MNLENLSLMCNIVASVVSKLGFTKYRRHDTPEKSIFLFALSNQGISTEDNWKTFPVMIEVETSFIKVKTIFSFKN